MSDNRLSAETSPYLLQHKDNPVNWRPWGPDALAEAQQRGRPILLSIGYAACHWCHVMAHESFEDADTAAVMNRLFVNIKVDREERPDIDHLYMSALHALGEPGGWPLTMVLTPTGEPVWGGTYFPKTSRYGRPAFTDVLQAVARVFAEEPGRVEQNRAALLRHLRTPPERRPLEPTPELLDLAAEHTLSLVDPAHGGLRGAPKFPRWPVLTHLFRAADRTGRAAFGDAALLTLRHIVQGGIYDHIGGGVCRYSVDERWLVPHFEKMLYDNAQLVDRLAQAFLVTGDPLFRVRIEETVDWLFREMVTDGAFASSLDADSPGGEGAFTVWRPAEIAEVLGSGRGAQFCDVYDITDSGNFEGGSIPNRLARQDWLGSGQEAALSDDREALRAARDRRPRPGRDGKILADWNGLAIAALARAGVAIGRPEWLDRATSVFNFVAESMTRAGRLGHAYRAGRLVFPGFASDHAAMAAAAISLGEATGEQAHLTYAAHLMAVLDRHYWDADVAAYRLTADDAPALIARPLPLTDEALPAANGLIAECLARLWQLTGDTAYRDRADTLLAAHAGAAGDNPEGAASLLNALDQRINGVSVILVGDSRDLLDTVERHRRDRHTLLRLPHGADPPPTHPARGKVTQDGQAAVYVCRGETCSLPVTRPDAVVPLLAG